LTEKLFRPIQVWHLVVMMLLAILTPIVAMAAQYGRFESEFNTVKTELNEHKQRLDSHDASINRIDRNVARIGQKLGIEMETPNQ